MFGLGGACYKKTKQNKTPPHKMAVFADGGGQRNKMAVMPKKQRGNELEDEKKRKELGRNELLFECVHVKPRQLLASFILH